MQFLNNIEPHYDLTYNDVFLVPGYSSLNSRFDVSLVTPDQIGTSIPFVVSNMTAVAGKRMAETVARRGGLAVLPQDIPLSVLEPMISYIKSRHLIYETPLTLEAHNTVVEALSIIHKRSHGAVIIVDKKNRPIGIFKEKDAVGYDHFTRLDHVLTSELETVPYNLNPKEMFELLLNRHISVAPVVKDGQLVGVITQKGSVRSSLFVPATDRQKRLLVAVAIGINGDVADKTIKMLGLGADIIVLDTAHGHQKKMLEAIKSVRMVDKKVILIAGNVVTAEGTRDLLEAGANIVKVGVGPGAMCTTRMMTGVGRPQFSAVYECAKVARSLGGHVWADGGIRYPRDVALALAAGASNVMIGSWLAGTYESTGDVLKDNKGRIYKENYGMASKRAVKGRINNKTEYEQSLKEFFEEGISTSKMYIDEEMPGVEDIIDHIIAGVRSSMTYSGAQNIDEFYEKAVIGIQSVAGYQEGKAVSSSWV